MPAHALGMHIDLSSPRGYYLDYSCHARTEGDRDDAGIPVVRARGGTRVPSPVLVARSALGNLEIYLENGAPDRRDGFLLLARWLISNIEYLPGSFGGWSMPDAPPRMRGRLPDGWFSASVQAECVATLVRAASLFREDGALGAARRAIGAFHTSIDDGGFLREIGESGGEAGVESLVFVEEYPIPGLPRMPLAGHIRAMWAMHDYLGVEDEPAARVLLRRCINGLAFTLDHFDLGYWTRSSLEGRRPRPACLAAHNDLVLMMDMLGRMTDCAEFAQTAARWRSYAECASNRARAGFERTISAVWNAGISVTPE